ncbi:MAG TPA: hypothetical protein PKN50_10780 [Spirochaetota bacterium]|nr:hypothetical protein [Spirochaetota bacterium]HPV41619.1 hypothetical protein [Spirochaetota bacterium]
MRHARYLMFISLVGLLGFLACSTGTTKTGIPTPSATLVGKWEGVDRTGKPGAFHFFEDGSVILVIDGKPLGGPDSSGIGRLRYNADYTKDPIELDIIGIDSNGVERGKILMIVKFISPDKIKIRTHFNDARPQNFDEETIDDTILLDRKAD